MTRYTHGTVPFVAALLVGSSVFLSAIPPRGQSQASGQWPQGYERLWGSEYRPNDEANRRRGPRHPRDPKSAANALALLKHWNHVAMDDSGLDHTPVLPGEHRVFGEELGPGRASRAMAMVAIAVFDAVNAIAGGYQSFTDQPRAPRGASMEAAISQAAHDTLVTMYPSQTADMDEELQLDLADLQHGQHGNIQLGLEVGRRAAAAILALHENDGSNYVEPRYDIEYIPLDAPGKWRQDPISKGPLALGALWGKVTPFVISSGARFRVPPPPRLNSAEYTDAYNEVKAIGGDGIVTPTIRTEEQTFIGSFWAYDGTPSLCAPPRLYNQIVEAIADKMGTTDPVDRARLIAVANVAMADAGIAIWESKYYYDFWRPVTGIRESDPGTGPTGSGDGNPNTVGDGGWSPIGAPASNLNGPNFTPPFPSYPSGHGGFGGAVFQVLRRFYGRDDVSFTIISDEWNGKTVDNQGHVRPLRPRSFTSFSQAEQENGQSRIYLGIHWAFDKTEAIEQGRRVANFVFDHAFQPVGRGDRDHDRR